MHPAFSVILFTVSSGTGYGMLFWLGLHSLAMRPSALLGLVVIGVALALITIGLLSSTFHLGRPERAWRALSQWRSSWLAREGVAAIAVYPPALLLAASLLYPDRLASWILPASLPMAALALVTVICTAMIYASLKPIREWHALRTVLLYGISGGTGGLVWIAAITRLLGYDPPFLVAPLVVAISGCWLIVRLYWHHVDRAPKGHTVADALGLEGATARAVEPAHTETNYLQREMGFVIARRHAAKLRRVAELLGFALPAALALLTLVLPLTAGAIALAVAALATTAGMLIQRWLFFAEATHTVTLYYGAERA